MSILAIGANSAGPAYMVYKEVGKGSVLNTGSVASAAWVERDAVLGGAVDRYLSEALKQH